MVLRGGSEEGEEVACVFCCDGCFDVVCGFGPADNGGCWWSVTGVDGPGSFVNDDGRFVCDPLTGLVEAAGGGVSVFAIPWPTVFVMAVGHLEFDVDIFFEGALDLL